MRAEKKYLIEEVAGHLKKSDYVILANYDKMTVADVAELRLRLAPHHAEFHVVKKQLAARGPRRPSACRASTARLIGPTAIILGGKKLAGRGQGPPRLRQEKQKIVVKAASSARS